MLEAIVAASEPASLFEGLYETAPDAIVVVDDEGIIRLVNRQVEALFGFTQEELLGHSIEILLPRRVIERHPKLRSSYFKDPRTRPMGAGLALTALRKDGTEVPVDISLSPLETEEGMLVSAAVRDVSERVAAEAARASLAAIISSSEDAIVGWTLDGRITSWNPSAERLYGYSADEAIGQNLSFLLWPEQAGETEQIIASIRSGERMDVYETTRSTKDRRRVDVSISQSPVFDSRGAIVGGASIHRDIGEKKRAEAQYQILKSQRLESLGQLAGGVAHDFNNLLAAIMNYAALIAESPDDPVTVRDDALEIKRAAERGAALTHQLLIFGRREIINPIPLELNATVLEMEKLLRRTIGEHIVLSTALEPELWTIKADPSGIEQVLMNLVVNARDAMPMGGTILIETNNVHMTETLDRALEHLSEGDYVRLTVADTGGGMAPDVIARAFEPFFTTKPKGQGSGLGLATVYGITTTIGGGVHIYSEPGMGTAVRVYLPISQEGAHQTPQGARTPAAGGGETILVVEDEDQVREPLVRVLKRNGYNVLAAAGGPAALKLASQRDGPIHLVLSDVVMPQMSGKTLAERFGAIRPDTKFLLMSGYPQDELERLPSGGGLPLIEKPFPIESLLQRVREVLDADRVDLPTS